MSQNETSVSFDHNDACHLMLDIRIGQNREKLGNRNREQGKAK